MAERGHGAAAEPPDAGTVVTKAAEAAKVWIARGEPESLEVLSFARRNNRQLDTFGGGMKDDDHQEYSRCALRELDEEVILPRKWMASIEAKISSHPSGQALAAEKCQPPGYQVDIALWLVRIPVERCRSSCCNDSAA